MNIRCHGLTLQSQASVEGVPLLTKGFVNFGVCLLNSGAFLVHFLRGVVVCRYSWIRNEPI